MCVLTDKVTFIFSESVWKVLVSKCKCKSYLNEPYILKSKKTLKHEIDFKSFLSDAKFGFVQHTFRKFQMYMMVIFRQQK